ncbi:hypothetical protein LguiB_034190 [Lonicera macranthoides]
MLFSKLVRILVLFIHYSLLPIIPFSPWLAIIHWRQDRRQLTGEPHVAPIHWINNVLIYLLVGVNQVTFVHIILRLILIEINSRYHMRVRNTTQIPPPIAASTSSQVYSILVPLHTLNLIVLIP